MSTGCQDLETRLVDYLYDELEPTERTEVDRHLSGCTGCRDALAALGGTRRLMSALPEAEPARSDDFVLQAAAREARTRQARSEGGDGLLAKLGRWISGHPGLVAGAMAGMVLLAVVGINVAEEMRGIFGAGADALGGAEAAPMEMTDSEPASDLADFDVPAGSSTHEAPEPDAPEPHAAAPEESEPGVAGARPPALERSGDGERLAPAGRTGGTEDRRLEARQAPTTRRQDAPSPRPAPPPARSPAAPPPSAGTRGAPLADEAPPPPAQRQQPSDHADGEGALAEEAQAAPPPAEASRDARAGTETSVGGMAFGDTGADAEPGYEMEDRAEVAEAERLASRRMRRPAPRRAARQAASEPAAEDTLVQGRRLVAQGHCEDALELLAGYTSTDAGATAEAHVLRGRCLDRLGRSEEAQRAYRAAAETAPQSRHGREARRALWREEAPAAPAAPAAVE